MAVTPPFVLRPLRPEDAASVHEVAARLGKWFDAEGLRRIDRDVMTHPGYVAAQEERLLGFILWARMDPEVADVSWMGVAEALQHRGIGTALLDAVVADLRAARVRFLEVSTVADKVEYEPYVATRRFYRARGFRDFRVDPLYWGTGADRYDRLVLRREISAPDGRHVQSGTLRDTKTRAPAGNPRRPLSQPNSWSRN